MKSEVINQIRSKISQNISILLALLIIFSAIVYYLYALNTQGVFLSIILSIISLIIINKFGILPKINIIQNNNHQTPDFNPQKIKLFIIYGAFLLASVFELISASSGRSLISPWEVVNKSFFLFYFFSALMLIILVVRTDIKNNLKLFLIGAQYFLSLAIAAIVYKVGYGFDPFIHKAAMEIIDQNGIILPKTPYYIGQYGLILALHKIFNISIYLLNKFLVPIAAACLLPSIIYNFFKTLKIKDTSFSFAPFIGTIFLLIFTFPLFIVSTPQNFSYLFIIISIATGLTDKNPWRATIFSFATAAIHPISGIPAIIWSSWLVFKKYQTKLSIKNSKLISAGILSGSAILLPVALFITSGGKLNNLHFNISSFISPAYDVLKFFSAGSENWLLNLTYFLFYNYKLIILILIISGLILFYKKLNQHPALVEKLSTWRGLLSIGASLIVAFFLSSQINFNQLIAYEQSDYNNRILTIITIFFIPFLAIAVNWLIYKIIFLKNNLITVIWITIGLIFMTSSLYLAYPRFDKYFNSRGYSTSTLDLEAVTKIDKGTNNNYIVLANQQVSAGALRLLGFNHYYQSAIGDIYFYPIPTGGALYQYYLDMVYQKPDRETMLTAMNLAGVDESYLVINKYWYESGKIINAAKLTADSWEFIGEKEIFIFKYNR